MNKIKICPICNKEYIGRGSICNNEHILYCSKCNKQILNLTRYKLLRYLKDGKIYCSYSCASDYKVISEKGKQTKLERYGDENYNNQNKMKETCLKKYGDENYRNAKAISKTRLSFTEEQNKEIEAKKRATFEKHYGIKNITNVAQIPEVAEKISSTLKQVIQDNYDNIISQRKQTSFQRYGDENYRNIEGAKKTKLERYGDENYNNTEKAKETCLERYGVPYSILSDDLNGNNFRTISKMNKKFADILKANNIDSKFEYYINGYKYDIFIEPNILIEINPTISHNSTISFSYCVGYSDINEPLDKLYHYNKTLNAVKNKFRCINIFDWDDSEKIINMLKPKEIISARKCNIKELKQNEANIFITKYHIQGKCNKQSICLGLYYKDELVQVMTFGKPRYNKNYEWELLRLCSSERIIGGSEKLFKYFIKNYKPKSIISYCDLSKFTGEVYERLNFKLIYTTQASKHWFNLKTNQHITDNLLRQRGYDQLFKTNYGKGTSNEQLMLENGFVEIYDCGQNTYIWIEK